MVITSDFESDILGSNPSIPARFGSSVGRAED